MRTGDSNINDVACKQSRICTNDLPLTADNSPQNQLTCCQSVIVDCMIKSQNSFAKTVAKSCSTHQKQELAGLLWCVYVRGQQPYTVLPD